MLVTCESNPAEIDELCRRCAACQQVDAARAQWSLLGRLAVGQAVALPITEEAGASLKLFTIGQRLTPHVRHRQKYVDVPVSEGRAFFFAPNGTGRPHRARTLRQFVDALEHGSTGAFDGYLRRGDFSHWVADVFGDYALADEMREWEWRYRAGREGDALPEIVSAIRARYDLTDDEVAGVGNTTIQGAIR
jgi:hypothetical protein